MSEPYVITRLCRDCVDGGCIEVCPVDCIYEERGGPSTLPNQLFINPEECIYCGACEPACPWEAIHAADAVPEPFCEDIALNALTDSAPERFDVAEQRLRRAPSPQEVSDNKQRWAIVDPALSA